MAYEFHYTPTGTGVISGKEVLEQTEDAINDLGNTAISGVQEALDKAEQALTNSENAVDDAQTALNTANNAEGVAVQAQNDVSNLSETVTNLGNRETTAEGNIDNLQGRMTTAEGNITNLQGRMTTAEGNIGNLQTAVSTAQATANSAQQTATTARQQSYVFRYSSTVLVDSSTNSNALLDNTDNLKVGDKVIDSSGVLFSITAIDTVNSTFTIGTSLIDLAQDSDVVHKSGDETVGGIKSFSDDTYITSLNFTNEVASPSSSSSSVMPIINTVTYTSGDTSVVARLNFRVTANGDKSLYPHENNQYSFGVASRRWTTLYGYLANLGGTYVGNEISANERTNLYLLANRDTDGQSGAYIGRFRQNRAQGAMSSGDVSFVSLDFLENSTRYTHCFTMGLTDWDSNGVPQTYYLNSSGGKGSLGTASNVWNKVYANEYYYGSTNTEFSSKFVTTDTAQTVSGVKIFSDSLRVYNSDSSANTAQLWLKNSKVNRGQTVYGDQAIWFRDATDKPVTAIVSRVTSSGASMLMIYAYNVNQNDQQVSNNLSFIKNLDGTCFLLPDQNNVVGLGSASAKWSDVQTYKVNALEPSSLSLPSSRDSRVDISSYFTDTSNGGVNRYTVPANGYIYLNVTDVISMHILAQTSNNLTHYGDTRGRNSVGQLYALLPVKKDDVFACQWYTTATNVTLNNAYFIPCLGNV